MSDKMEVPAQLLQAVKTSLEILGEAIEKEEDQDKQVAFRRGVAIGTYDSAEGGSFQIIVEICVKEDFFIPDGQIAIITDPQHTPAPYKIIPPEKW